MIGKLNNLRRLGLAFMAIAASSGALADMPASSVTTTVVNPNQSYPEVPANGEGWFDVGGFCKVVDVGNLSSLSSTANGVPVFIPGPAAPVDQWENYRTLAGTHYNGQLTLTTCCRPQSNIATLCTEDGATPVPVSRQYGKLGETDTVTATCNGNNGPYQDSVSLICSGDNGPDGQATWSESGPDTPSCTTAPTTTYGACSTAGVGGWGNQLVTVTNCLGQVLSQSYTGPACYTAPPCTPNYQFSHCNNTNAVYTDVNSCPGSTNEIVAGGCSLQPGAIVQKTCNPNCSVHEPDAACPSGPGDVYHDCSCHNWGCPAGTVDLGSCGEAIVTETFCGVPDPGVPAGTDCENCQTYSYQPN